MTENRWTEPVTGIEFVLVPGGCFEMGSMSGNDEEKPVRQVCVEDFWLGKHEVTQGQWQRLMDYNKAHFKKGDNFPMEQVAWLDIQSFITKLNKQHRHDYRLPTEAEWEYACRSGGLEETYCGGEDVDRLAWYMDSWFSSGSDGSTVPVGIMGPNGFGLYDMSGNVGEFVQDCWNDSYQGAPSDGRARESGQCDKRVIRGGHFMSLSWGVRSTSRSWLPSKPTMVREVGFRLAKAP